MSSIPRESAGARPALDARTVAVIALVIGFLVIGTLGHDPWKPDEAYVFGMVYHILETGDWVVPTLAGEPFMEKPPLYYIAAAMCARLFSAVLPLHDGARLASTGFALMSAVFTGIAARKLFGPGHALNAALLLLCAVGFAPHAHSMVTDMALLAGFAVAFCGIAFLLDRPRLGGAVLGTGIGIGFLSKGLVQPAMVGIALVLLPAFAREWRSRAYAQGLAWALLFASPWMLVWPLALYQRSFDLFVEWFWRNNVGRYLGFANLGADDEPFFFTRTLAWFTLPGGALAAHGVAVQIARGGFALPAAYRACIAFLAGILVVLGTSASVRDLYALPALLPLAAMGSAALREFPRRIGFAWSAATAVLALAIALAACAVWLHGIATSKAPPIPILLHYLPKRFDFRFDPMAVACACALTLLWLYLWLTERAGSWLRLWAANLAFGWGVTMALLLPWLDEAKSFRKPFEHIMDIIPTAECVNSVGLGEGQRGMLHYVSGIKTLRVDEDRLSGQCNFALLQSSHDGRMPPLPAGYWARLWEGSRHGERDERFAVYVRDSFADRTGVVEASR